MMAQNIRIKNIRKHQTLGVAANSAIELMVADELFRRIGEAYRLSYPIILMRPDYFTR